MEHKSANSYIFIITSLILISLLPGVYSQGDVYPWELNIEYPDDDAGNPFELSNDGGARITFTVTNDGLFSIDVSFEYEKAFPGEYSGPSEGTIEGQSNESFTLQISNINILNFIARAQEAFTITANLDSIQDTPQLFPSSNDAEGKLMIPIIYLLDIEIEDPVGPMNAGSSMPLRVTVTNKGNIEDRVGEIEITDNCPLLSPNNGLDSLMTANLIPGKSIQSDLELSASESHPRRNCKVEITVASNGGMNTGSQSLVSDDVQVVVDPPLTKNDPNSNDDSTTTTTEVIGSSLPFLNSISIICCIFTALVFSRKN
ncbi:MAG: hypothetical protein ACI9O1_001168 [Candidatus Thalassarchaeaceae archaeon]|jgi:hypothetical protein